MLNTARLTGNGLEIRMGHWLIPVTQGCRATGLLVGVLLSTATQKMAVSTKEDMYLMTSDFICRFISSGYALLILPSSRLFYLLT